MKERPILFSGPMVRAILAGTKTQTRRIIPDRHLDDAPPVHFHRYLRERCPYGQPGDRLWVRETFLYYPAEYVYEASTSIPCVPAQYIYRADAHSPEGPRWTPSIFMPRHASRITLEVTDVRVERLQEISEDDARAEGGPPSHWSIDRISREYGYEDFPRSWFAQLWDSINAKRVPWSSNPWVWVLTFRRLP